MNEKNKFKGKLLFDTLRVALNYESGFYDTSFTPSRSIAQTILYEIYFKPDGLSFEDSGLLQLREHEPFIGSWTIWDHRIACSKIQMGQNNMKHFKDMILPSLIYKQDNHKHEPEFTQRQYNRIIDFYETTGFLGPLPCRI